MYFRFYLEVLMVYCFAFKCENRPNQLVKGCNLDESEYITTRTQSFFCIFISLTAQALYVSLRMGLWKS